jgi:FKBP-type peptidyl-prolyl cis-trans isomerase SlyD
VQIENRKIVTIDYTLTDDKGEVLDTSQGSQPLTYLHGSGNIIPGLETALEGRATGDSFRVVVDPPEGYGERDERLVQSVPRARFPTREVEVGMQFQIEGQGGTLVVTVIGVDAEVVTLDGNHPLAGATLSFDVTVLDVRDATLEELSHGHAHGEGGHHH